MLYKNIRYIWLKPKKDIKKGYTLGLFKALSEERFERSRHNVNKA